MSSHGRVTRPLGYPARLQSVGGMLGAGDDRRRRSARDEPAGDTFLADLGCQASPNASAPRSVLDDLQDVPQLIRALARHEKACSGRFRWS